MLNSLKPVSSTEYIVLFILCFVCFLIGWFFAKRYYRRKYKSDLAACQKENERLTRIKQEFKPAVTSLAEGEVAGNGIKAIKTRGRSGAAVSQDPSDTTEKKQEKPKLNFSSFGRADESHKDDLKKISGIGPFIEQKLNEIGIYTYEQISRFQKEDINTVTELIEFFPGRIERDDWVKQAADLNKKK